MYPRMSRDFWAGPLMILLQESRYWWLKYFLYTSSGIMSTFAPVSTLNLISVLSTQTSTVQSFGLVLPLRTSPRKMLFSEVPGISSLCTSWTFEDLQTALRCPFLLQLLQTMFLAGHSTRLWKSLPQKYNTSY